MIHANDRILILSFILRFCRPFYRTEMLIIVPKNQSQWLRPPVGDDPARLYGSALRKDLLHEACINALIFMGFRSNCTNTSK